MAREFLKGIKAENRINKIRVIEMNRPVIGGQPSDNMDEFTSSDGLRDLACTIKHTQDQVEAINNSATQISIVDAYGYSTTDAGSQRLITELRDKKADKFVRYLRDEHINNANEVGLYIVYSDIYQTKENGYPSLEEVLPTNACSVRVTMIDNSAMLQELFNEKQYFVRRVTNTQYPVWSEYFNDHHLSQNTGADERKLMSQKAITESTCALGDIQDTPTYSLNQTFGDNMAAAITTVPKNAVIVGAYSEKWPAAAIRFRPIIRTGGGNLV